jgi:DNA-binding transcriptional regulator YdaS (Cro superfamily)
MGEMSVTWGHVAAIVAACAGLATVLSVVSTLVSGWIQSKIPTPATKAVEEQSAQCKFDHEGIRSLMLQQNANIAALLAQNAKMIDAFTSMSHAAELRHRTVLERLRALHVHVHKQQPPEED